MFLQDLAFNSFGYIPRYRIAGSYDVSIFRFLRKHHIAIHSGCTILDFYQQHTRVLISLHSYQHLLISLFVSVFW